MVARGPGAVGCAHCTLIGAEVACAVCGRLVCPRCAADWATCGEPSGRVLRLGRGARLRDVDPAGRLGLVWRLGTVRVLDLRRLGWVEVRLERGLTGIGHPVPLRLAGHGIVIHGRYSQENLAFFDGVYARALASGDEDRIAGDAPARGGHVTADGAHYVYVTDTERVVIVALTRALALPDAVSSVLLATEPPPRLSAHVARYEPLPRKVVQAVTLDVERGLLASASWGEIVLHRVRDASLELVGLVGIPGDVRFVALGGPWLVAASRHDRTTHLRAWAIDHPTVLGQVAWQLEHSRPLAAASLSRDGRYLAAAFGTEILVRDLTTGSAATFSEHTDEITLVRFVGGDQVLVTADADNRVILRPRTATGYARALREIPLRDEPLPLP